MVIINSKYARILKNEAFVKFLFSTIPVGISITTDQSCKRIIHNPEAAKIFRVSSWESYSHSNNREHLFHLYYNDKQLLDEEMPIQVSMWKGEEIYDMEMDVIWEDGTKKTILMSSVPIRDEYNQPIGVLATSKNVTNLRQIERDLRSHEEDLEKLVKEQLETIYTLQSEFARLDKLDIVGQMAASLAHEVRNPLTIVKGMLQLFLMVGGPTDPKRQYKVMIDAVDQADSIIRNFLDMTKNEAKTIEDCNLNDIIETLYPLILAGGLENDISVKLETEPVPSLELNKQQIRQVLMNLARNGIEAMSPGKTLTIRTYIEGEDVVLSVADQGQGIPLEIREQIGKSFFTTKEQGTGIGLAVCYRLVKKHNAKMTFESNAHGTTFYVKFRIR